MLVQEPGAALVLEVPEKTHERQDPEFDVNQHKTKGVQEYADH